MTTTSNQPDNVRIGPISLAPGITRFSFSMLVFAAMAHNCLMSFINIMQPLILEEILQVPADQQGTVSGNLTFVSELVALGLLGLFGALSDRTGRRPILIFGFVMLGAGYLLYPHMDSTTTLYASRAVFAVGVAATSGMMATILNDYPAESSRGRMMAVGGVAAGVGGMLITAFAQLPTYFESTGLDTTAAIRLTLLWMTGGCLVTALILHFGLSGSRGTTETPSEPLLARMFMGARAARNPRIALAYASAFVARSDFIVVGTFFILWYVQSAVETGMTTADATAAAGIRFLVILASALVSAPFIGVLIDKIDRVKAQAICMAVVAAGYTAMGLLGNPLSPLVWPIAAVVGVGMMSGFLASQALIGESAEPKLRGSIIGLFGLSGAAGILFVSFTGGIIYDDLLRSGPFLLTGAMATILVFWSVIISRSETRNANQQQGQHFG